MQAAPLDGLGGIDIASYGLSNIDTDLLKKLLKSDVLHSDEIRILASKYAANDGDLNSMLIDFGFIKESELSDFLFENYGYKIFNLKGAEINKELARKVPKSVATRNKVLVYAEDETKIYFAAKEVMNLQVPGILSSYLRSTKTMVPQYCKVRDILDCIETCYGSDAEQSLDSLVGKMDIRRGLGSGRAKGGSASVNSDNEIGAISVQFVERMLIEAVQDGASDLHIEPEESFVRVRLRIDGVLRKAQIIGKPHWGNILNRIKVISNMNITETRKPQDGRIEMTICGRPVDFRISSHPTVNGENVVIRVLDRNKSLTPLRDLGISEFNCGLIEKSLGVPEGIIIVTGPTGSGKTTTLYSCLAHVNSSSINVMTLENPVEYTIPLIRQTSVREDIGLSFDGGIRSIMRQDPDVIMIGEIRDLATAQAAVRASLTGHKVLSTLHTIDSISVVQRLVDIGIDKYMLSGNLVSVVAQRLVRRLCLNCKNPHKITDEEAEVIGLPEDLNYSNLDIFTPEGCDNCSNTGYKGRIIITEVLSIDNDLDDLIATTVSRKQIFNMAKSKGFITLADDVINRVIEGVTSIDEAKRVVKI